MHKKWEKIGSVYACFSFVGKCLSGHLKQIFSQIINHLSTTSVLQVSLL